MLSLPVFRAVELARRLGKTPQAIFRSSENFSKIRLIWTDENGKKRTNKFYLPKGYKVVKEDL